MLTFWIFFQTCIYLVPELRTFKFRQATPLFCDIELVQSKAFYENTMKSSDRDKSGIGESKIEGKD